MTLGKFKRNERIGGIVKVLCDTPNKIYTLNHFTAMFNAAKSTISEDIVIVKRVMEDLELGIVETISGAAGGVRYIPKINSRETEKVLSDICETLRDESRIISGGFIYTADIIYNPHYVKKIGEIFGRIFADKPIDYILTLETKGIPLAIMTANTLNVPLVIARDDNRVTEGSTVSINYVSGSTGSISTMYVSKRAVKTGSNVLIIDDFMRAGGTAKGLVDLMTEFDANVVGIGVMIATKEPEKKMVDDYVSLISLEAITRDKSIVIHPKEEFCV